MAGQYPRTQTVLKKALLNSRGTVLLTAFLPEELSPDARKADAIDAPRRYRPGVSLSELECEAIQDCLNGTGGNRQQTAEMLGISTARSCTRSACTSSTTPCGPTPAGGRSRG